MSNCSVLYQGPNSMMTDQVSMIGHGD